MEKEENQPLLGEELKGPEIKYKRGSNKLDSYNWLSDISEMVPDEEIVEVQFKNTRKGLFRNVNNLKLTEGDVVAVEASPGHDIGIVSLSGPLVSSRYRRMRNSFNPEELKKIYRKAKPADIQKWEEARAQEEPTMLKSRKLAIDLGLNMKIGDVEYQGDKTKAIFYYIADERVDFRQLIRILAEEFKVRIEMRQIGARQEAGRIGGIGSCGRELCCSTHITNFVSVTTTHAKYQELSLNPQKLAGQCSKLKCCLNYEFDCYVDAQKDFPPRDLPLEIFDGTVWFQKMEIHKRIYWYSTDKHHPVNLTPVGIDRVKEIIKLNRKGIKPDRLVEFDVITKTPEDSGDILNNDSLNRFDRDNRRQGKKKDKKRGRRPDEKRKN